MKSRLAAALALALLAASNAAAQTQAEMNRAADRALGEAKAALATAIAGYRQRLDAPQLAAFDASQARWEAYRQAACRYQASGVEGGSAYPMILAGCFTDLTAERLAYLRRLASCEEGDMACPAPR